MRNTLWSSLLVAVGLLAVSMVRSGEKGNRIVQGHG